MLTEMWFILENNEMESKPSVIPRDRPATEIIKLVQLTLNTTDQIFATIHLLLALRPSHC